MVRSLHGIDQRHIGICSLRIRLSRELRRLRRLHQPIHFLGAGLRQRQTLPRDLRQKLSLHLRIGLLDRIFALPPHRSQRLFPRIDRFRTTPNVLSIRHRRILRPPGKIIHLNF